MVSRSDIARSEPRRPFMESPVTGLHPLAAAAAPLAAGFSPARGFPPSQVIPATAVAVLLTAAVVLGAVRYRQGRFAALDRLAGAVESHTGLPAWAALPGLLTTVSLLIAVFGFY